MNKTIADAYKELKGDLGNTCMFNEVDKFLQFGVFMGNTPYLIDTGKNDFTGVQYICTVEEFNNYKGDDVKTPLEKESEVDYTSEEFWKDAPEWATDFASYAIIGQLDRYRYWLGDNGFCIVGDESVGIDLYGATSRDSDGDIATNHKRCAFHIWASRPKPQPVFTQAMADAGELPSVGVE